MTIVLPTDIESALNQSARARGLTPEAVAIEVLRERLATSTPAIVPQDDWERGLLAIAQDCGVSLSHETLTRDAMYP